MTCTVPYDLSIQNDAFINMKLPPIFIQAFSINNHQAKCETCNFTCKPKENDILFHLTICGGSLIGDKIKTTLKFNCLICSFKTINMYEWKNHLFKSNLIFKHSCSTKYSFVCNSCNTHFYGFKDEILKHQCKPKSLSILSELMAYVYKSFDFHHKRMLYFCSDCEHYSYDVTDLHVTKCCKALINSATSVCESCLITFYDSSEKTFLDHKVSFEHMLLWCLNSKKEKKMRKNHFPKLPISITNYFETSFLLRQVRCIVCCKILSSSYDCIYNHFMQCISLKEISSIDISTPLNSVHCSVCKYKYSTQDENMYENWVKHVISSQHLNKISKNKNELLSFYWSDSKTMFYGTQEFINTQMFQINNIIGHSLFVSQVTAKAYKHSLELLNCSVLFGCGFCQSVEVCQPKKLCEHENIDSSQLFYCSCCLVKFNVKTDYTEHLLSSEHIILKYFKPNQTSKLKNLKYSLETMKMHLSNLIENDDKNECFSLSDQNSNIEEHNHIESKNVFDESHTSKYTTTENQMEVKNKLKRKNDELSNQTTSTNRITEMDNVLNCMRKLSMQTQKSALNNYLRMKFELLNEMPSAINVFSESKSFFCTMCDSVFCNQSDWISHYTEIHDKIINPSVFYCTICHIYHISTSISINDHIQTLEHKVMLEFQENMTNHSTKPKVHNLVNFTSTEGVEMPLEENKDEANQNSKKFKKNHNIYVEIKDIDANLKRNNYSSLRNLILKKYGKFTEIANQSNSFIIFFEEMNQVDNFINDEKELKKQYGFKLQTLGQNKELSSKTKELFSNWKTFKTIISNHLLVMESSDEAKVEELCDSVRGLNVGTNTIHVYVFGSRLYKLASEKSDVDLYLDIGGTFNGDIADDIDRQVDLVKMFAQQCYLKCDEFQNIEEICDARVPIIKFYHVPTKFNCDVSFKSGLSLYKSKLIKLYLSSHYEVKWLVCAVKCWALDNNLIDRTIFTSYALVWLVLFYLMTKKIIPPLVELVKNATKDDKKIIEGWDCTFGKLSKKITVIPNRPTLIFGFFEYYAMKKKLKNQVLSVFTGESINKNKFFKTFCKLPGLSKIQQEKLKRYQSKINSSFINYHGLAIHDPFELSFNITRNICNDNLTDFCDLCDQSATILNNSKGFKM